MCLYIYIYIKLVNIVDQKASFSIATTPRCRGGRYSFPRIAPLLPLICTLYCWVLSKEVSSTIFKVFGMTRPGIEPKSPSPLVNTQTIRPMSQLIIIIIIVDATFQACPNGWSYRIYRLHLCRGVRSPSLSVWDMILSYLMLRCQYWSSGECRVTLHCHYSQVHSFKNFISKRFVYKSYIFNIYIYIYVAVNRCTFHWWTNSLIEVSWLNWTNQIY